MKIAISQHPVYRRVNRRKLRALIAWCLPSDGRALPGSRYDSLQLVVTDDATIAVLHQRWMGVPGPTDVLSQRYEALPGEAGGLHGEIVVNLQRACEQGPRHWRHRRPPVAAACELALYVAHGCDHLMGADDATPADRRRMRRRELRWIRTADAAGLVTGLLAP